MDENWRRAIISEQGDIGGFFSALVASPLSLTLLLIVIAVLLGQLFKRRPQAADANRR